MSDNYTCTGVRIENGSGKKIDFKAKAVVLATGGMSTKEELFGMARFMAGAPVSQ